jgi:predicted transcriptional regulator of viral defense system
VRSAGDIIQIADAARVLDLDHTSTAKMLSRWTAQGWLRRVGRGAYAAANLDSLASEHVLEDPWVLVPPLYDPAYIGGRTAAEHWDLTEQIFNDVVVMTTRDIREKSQRRHGVVFSLKHVSDAKLFGTRALWRVHTKVQISDVHRTMIDIIDDPAVGGGIRQTADCLTTYLRRPDRDDARLIDYAERLGNGAVFKRLGFLIEGEPGTEQLSAACRDRLSKGNAKLDPALECPKLISRWRLWVPAFWQKSVRT